VIAILLCVQLAALPPLKLIVVCGAVNRGARVNKAVNRVVYVACKNLRAPHLSRQGTI
jgi:hypothetical protein